MALLGSGSAMPAVLTPFMKVALHRPPPVFSVEVLSPTKHGDFYYRMLVSSVKSSNPPYEIWRSWSDCLIFQQTLEEKYASIPSLPKEQRSLVSDDSIHQEAASPFEYEYIPLSKSKSTTRSDIHDYLPTLTKKGTMFWDSPATVQRRKAELEVFITYLFSSDAPGLLCELRERDRMVTDFFAFWRSDDDMVNRKVVAGASGFGTNHSPNHDVCPPTSRSSADNQPGRPYSMGAVGPVGGSCDFDVMPYASTSTLASTTTTMTCGSTTTAETVTVRAPSPPPLSPSSPSSGNAGFRHDWWRLGRRGRRSSS